MQNGKRLSSAVGLGQILDGTWRDICRIHAPQKGQSIHIQNDRFDPDKQILAMCLYLEHLKTQNSCDDRTAVALYHTGSRPTDEQARKYAPGNRAISKGDMNITGREYFDNAIAYYNTPPTSYGTMLS